MMHLPKVGFGNNYINQLGTQNAGQLQ